MVNISVPVNMEWTDLLGWGSEMALSVVGQMEMDKSPDNVFIKPIHLASLWVRWKPFQVVPGDISRHHRLSGHVGMRHG